MGIRPVWSVFTVRWMGSYGPKLSSCGQQRLWSDWADAQADLPGWSARLIWVFAGCTHILLVLSCRGSYTIVYFKLGRSVLNKLSFSWKFLKDWIAINKLPYSGKFIKYINGDINQQPPNINRLHSSDFLSFHLGLKIELFSGLQSSWATMQGALQLSTAVTKLDLFLFLQGILTAIQMTIKLVGCEQELMELWEMMPTV